MVDGVVRAFGAQAMCLEIGLVGTESPVELGTDSSAAKSFASRRGLGKARHIHTRCLWLQQAVVDRQVLVRKVAGTENPADLLAKSLAIESACRMAKLMGLDLYWRPRV